jgi:hypothetical protein
MPYGTELYKIMRAAMLALPCCNCAGQGGEFGGRREAVRVNQTRIPLGEPPGGTRSTRFRLDYEYPYFQHRYPYRDYRYRYCDCRYPYCATVLIIVVFTCPCAAVHQRKTASCSDRPRSAAGGGRECAERPAAWRRCRGRDPTKGRPHGRAERSEEPRPHSRAYARAHARTRARSRTHALTSARPKAQAHAQRFAHIRSAPDGARFDADASRLKPWARNKRRTRLDATIGRSPR